MTAAATVDVARQLHHAIAIIMMIAVNAAAMTPHARRSGRDHHPVVAVPVMSAARTVPVSISDHDVRAVMKMRRAARPAHMPALDGAHAHAITASIAAGKDHQQPEGNQQHGCPS